MILLHEVWDFECHEHAREKEELVEAEVGWIDSCVPVGLEVLFECPRVIHGSTHCELGNTEHHYPHEAQDSHTVHHLQVSVLELVASRFIQLSNRVLNWKDPSEELFLWFSLGQREMHLSWGQLCRFWAVSYGSWALMRTLVCQGRTSLCFLGDEVLDRKDEDRQDPHRKYRY